MGNFNRFKKILAAQRMLNRLFNADLLKNQEFHSALVRLGVWLFAVIYIGLGAVAEHYDIYLDAYYTLFGSYFIIFMALMLDVLRRPVWQFRRYLSLIVDITATSLCIYMIKDPINPFYLFYIWIFVSYGTRYGKNHLLVASVASVFAYLTVLALLGQWQSYLFELFFLLLALMVLPLYQYSLLKKLHQARQDAESSDQAKSAFLSTMTHELRTPISGVIGMAHLLKETPLNEEQQEYVHSITASARLLDNLIGDVLDQSKMEAAGLELKREPVDIRALICEICSTLSSLAFHKRVELICRIDERIPRLIRGDGLRLKQVLINLLTNAIKFTDQGHVALSVETVTDSVAMAKPHLLIQVEDTGIGIAIEQQPHIFDRFWQGDSSSKNRQGGTGLGTSISRSLVELMDGKIGFNSIEGKGSTFWVRLPLDQASLGAQPERPEDLSGHSVLVFESNPLVREVLEGMFRDFGMRCHSVSSVGRLSETVTQVEEEGGVDFVLIADSPEGQEVIRIADIIRSHLDPALPVIYLGYWGRRVKYVDPRSCFLVKPVIQQQLHQTAQKLLMGDLPAPQLLMHEAPPSQCHSKLQYPVKVLIAEDNAINAKVLSTLLKDIGCDVAWARDGDEALVMAESEHYDIAFVDLRMPKRDGIDFSRTYRDREPEGRQMPIIALTANAAGNARQLCMDAGMNDFLAKPVDAELLISIIHQYTGEPTGAQERDAESPA